MLSNETGLDIHTKGKSIGSIARHGLSIKDRNGGSTTIYLKVPSSPANTGTPIPGIGLIHGAPCVQVFANNRPAEAHRNDRSDNMPMTVKYIPGTPQRANRLL